MSRQPVENTRRPMPTRVAGLYDGLDELGVLTSTVARRRAARQERNDLRHGVGRRHG
jgi:hypothetical protein